MHVFGLAYVSLDIAFKKKPRKTKIILQVFFSCDKVGSCFSLGLMDYYVKGTGVGTVQSTFPIKNTAKYLLLRLIKIGSSSSEKNIYIFNLLISN